MSTSQPSEFPKLMQEENRTQECKELMSTLPREMSYGSDYVYQYNGFWLLPFHLEGIPSCQKHFQAHDTDILLATVPKSGTTWLKSIAFALLNRRHYDRHTQQHHPLLTTFSHDLVPFLESRLYFRGQEPDLTSFTSPRLFSTHMPFTMLPKSVKESSSKLVYLCRDPKDTLISLWHFSNNLTSSFREPTSLEEMFDCFCRGLVSFGPLWDHALSYWRESLKKPEKVLFLKYEEMKEQPPVQLRRIAEFLGCPFSQDEETSGLVDEIVKLCSFGNLSNLEVNKNERSFYGIENKALFRRGEVGDWKNYLTADMADRLDKIWEQKLDGSGLKF